MVCNILGQLCTGHQRHGHISNYKCEFDRATLKVTQGFRAAHANCHRVTLQLFNCWFHFLLIIRFLAHMATHYQLNCCVHARLSIVTLVEAATRDRHYT